MGSKGLGYIRSNGMGRMILDNSFRPVFICVGWRHRVFRGRYGCCYWNKGNYSGRFYEQTNVKPPGTQRKPYNLNSRVHLSGLCLGPTFLCNPRAMRKQDFGLPLNGSMPWNRILFTNSRSPAWKHSTCYPGSLRSLREPPVLRLGRQVLHEEIHELIPHLDVPDPVGHGGTRKPINFG